MGEAAWVVHGTSPLVVRRHGRELAQELLPLFGRELSEGIGVYCSIASGGAVRSR